MSAVAIVALDTPGEREALSLVEQLDGLCTFYKVGSELFTAAGPAIVRALRGRGCDVFLDLKFHDIPNTVAGGIRAAAGLGARLVTVHASGGTAMLRAAVKAAGDPQRCGVLAVTLLTSLSAPEAAEAWGREGGFDPAMEVQRLAGMASAAGAHGIVCSGLEAPIIRERYGTRLAMLVPGVRLAGGATQDQARVVTPADAANAGASWVVLGRTVTQASDPRAAMSEALRQLG